VRWVWRGFTALGIAVLVAGLVAYVLLQVQMYRRLDQVHNELRLLCVQFTAIECSKNYDLRWNSDKERWEYGV
jgi:hypothetical protein